MSKNAFLIAAPRSNSGKTLITLGLIKALRNKGYSVQAYKCGPDYIDPMHHKIVSGRPSYNLDTWMDNHENVKALFNRHLQNADIGIAEGVMGLFDGAKKDSGSSAEIARLLSLPIILVVDASSVAYSVAPLLYGFKNFDKNINISGVIFNKTGSESHARILEEGAKDAGVEMLGHIPRDKRLSIESRHLGLHLPGENKNYKLIDIAANLAEDHIHLDRLFELSRINTSFSTELLDQQTATSGYSIAIANDEAFNFTYQANIDALRELGKIKFFSPLTDKNVPDVDLIWLPGGYPELFGQELAANTSMLKSINAFIEAGKPVVAECGGMMYLGNSIIDKNGDSHSMADVFNFSTSFENMKLHLGYREFSIKKFTVRGHEFHYSELIKNNCSPIKYQAKTARGLNIDMPLFRYKNCWASYMHLYLGNKNIILNFLKELDEDFSQICANLSKKSAKISEKQKK